MLFLEILLGLRRARKAMKTARIARLAVAVREAAITTQAAAYGFEIGTGKTLAPVVDASPQNPFLDPNWREYTHEIEGYGKAGQDG